MQFQKSGCETVAVLLYRQSEQCNQDEQYWYWYMIYDLDLDLWSIWISRKLCTICSMNASTQRFKPTNCFVTGCACCGLCGLCCPLSEAAVLDFEKVAEHTVWGNQPQQKAAMLLHQSGIQLQLSQLLAICPGLTAQHLSCSAQLCPNPTNPAAVKPA